MNYKSPIKVLILAVLISVNLHQSAYAFGFLKEARGIGTSSATPSLYKTIDNLEKLYNGVGQKYFENNIREAQEEVSKKATDAVLDRVIFYTDPETLGCQMDFFSISKHVTYQTNCQDTTDLNFTETYIPAEYWDKKPPYPRYNQLRVDYGDFLDKLLNNKDSAYLLKNGPKVYSLSIFLNDLDTTNPYWEASILSWDEDYPYNGHTFRMSAKTPDGKITIHR